MGIGGISKWEDIVEFALVGASAMQVGTANFVDPQIPLDIIDGLDKYLTENNISNLSEITARLIYLNNELWLLSLFTGCI